MIVDAEAGICLRALQGAWLGSMLRRPMGIESQLIPLSYGNEHGYPGPSSGRRGFVGSHITRHPNFHSLKTIVDFP